MPKKNKAIYNGFYFFMCEYKSKKGISMQQASVEAGAVWQTMSQAEKDPYLSHAADMKSKSRGGGRQTALNEDMDLVLQQETEERQAAQRMENDIKSTVKRFVDGETIASEYFHIMHINVFCYVPLNKMYYPAEIGLLRFNFDRGVEESNIYHSMIQPGQLPKGYALSAKSTSEETHKIPPPPGFDAPESNMYEIIQRILLFMKEYENNSVYPPIFVNNKNMTLVSEVLAQMCGEMEMEPCFKVYSLEYLLFTIRNNLSDHIVWPTVSQSIHELERDVYDYTEGICCSFHETCDMPLHCSKSIITRFAYILCDNCCPSMGIALVPGHHIPKNKIMSINSNAGTTVSYANTTKDSSSSSSSERYSTAMEDDWLTVKSGRHNYSGSVYSIGSVESVQRRPLKMSMASTGETPDVSGVGSSSAGSSRVPSSMGGVASLEATPSTPQGGYILPIGRGRGRGGYGYKGK